MILPDVNILVHAHRRESPDHEACAAWLGRALVGVREVALADAVLTGFLRVVTNPRVMSPPTPTADALGFVTRLQDAPSARPVGSTRATWREFADLIRDDRQIRGNLVPDAWLAALALSHGCAVATADRGFARFPGLELVDPARGGFA